MRGGDDTDQFNDLRNITGDGRQLERIRQRVVQFTLHVGRRPRVLVDHAGFGPRNQSINRIGSMLAMWGFDVDIGPRQQSPSQIARMAIENDVHMVILMGHGSIPQQRAEELTAALTRSGVSDILVAVFGNLTPNPATIAGRPAPAGPSEPMIFNPQSADDVIVMLDKLARKN